MVAALLFAGHDAADVMDSYSMDEIEAHYEALVRHRAKVRLENLVDLSVAMNATAKQRRQHIKALSGVPKMIAEATGGKDVSIGSLFSGLKTLKKKRTKATAKEDDDG